MNAQALADYGCPYSEEFTTPREKTLFQKARRCKLTQKPCWNWNNMDAVMRCDVKKKKERAEK